MARCCCAAACRLYFTLRDAIQPRAAAGVRLFVAGRAEGDVEGGAQPLCETEAVLSGDFAALKRGALLLRRPRTNLTEGRADAVGDGPVAVRLALIRSAGAEGATEQDQQAESGEERVQKTATPERQTNLIASVQFS